MCWQKNDFSKYVNGKIRQIKNGSVKKHLYFGFTSDNNNMSFVTELTR